MTQSIRRWLERWVPAATVIALTCAPLTAQTTPEAPAAANVEQVVRQDLQRLATKLNDPGARQEERDEAARRLVSRQTPAARAIVADALVNLNPNGQLAAARALGDDSNPDPALINPLFATLGVNRPLTEAAATALANYKNRPEVVARLIEFAQGRPSPEITRLAVIRAIGSMPQKRSAEFLITLLRKTDESPAVRNTAAEALAELTGIPDGSGDPQRWIQWWEANSNISESAFRSDLLTSRSARYDQIQQQFNQLVRETASLLKEQYRSAGGAQRPELLLRFLRTPDPQIRAIAAGIVYDDALDGQRPAGAVLEQLRELIGDSSPGVRHAVADALGRINDAASFEALLAQLAQEPDASVRASLASALGPMNDIRAVPVLVAMLSDQSLDAAQAAARALSQLGPSLREKDPNLAQRTAAALRDMLEQRTGTPQTAELRKRLVGAMVPLRQEELASLFTRMFDERRGESAEVRQLAIQGIGELGNKQSAGVLVLALDDRSPLIRREAVLALAKNPALAENAEPLRKMLDPAQEPDESVRNAAWRALESVFPALPREQLVVWADRFKEDPNRRLVVLFVLEKKLLQDDNANDLADTRQNIAQALMSQKDYKRAAEYYGLALEYKKTQSISGGAIEALIEERMKALLKSKDYSAAVNFAAQMIQEIAGIAQPMGSLIWNEAQTLSQEGDLQSALDLIEAANNMKELPEDYRERLSTVQREVRQRQSQQNGAEPPPGPRSAGTTIPSNGRPRPARRNARRARKVSPTTTE